MPEEAILRDLPDPTNLLLARLDNWAATVRNFEDYVDAHILLQKSISTGLEKARKIAGESPHFESPNDLPPGPLGASLQHLRTNTDTVINKSSETELALKKSVLPPLQTLRADIDKHIKGLKASSLKQAKDVEKARSATLSAIEALGTHASSFSIAAASNRHEYRNDPYVLYRLALNAIDDQLAKENAHSDALIFTEKNLQSLEAHLVQVFQQASHLFAQTITAFHSLAAESYSDTAASFAAIPPDAEWADFATKNAAHLVPYDRPKRQIANVSFHNDTHPATIPVIEGMLSRKEGKLLKSWTPGYYVLTPSHFLLQYASNNYVQHPAPDFAVYLPDAIVSEVQTKDSGKFKFTVQAKDGTKAVGLTTKTFSFRANSLKEVEEWQRAMAGAGKAPAQTPTQPPVASQPPVAPSVASQLENTHIN